MLFRRPITYISPNNFNSDAVAQSLELRLSKDFSKILEEIKVKDSFIFQVYGEPGSGCSTLVQGLCRHLCGIKHIKEDEILYLSLNQDCNEKSLWDLMSKLAKERNDKENAELFSKISVQKDEKIKAFLTCMNFKVICFDDADCNENFIESFLDHLVEYEIKAFIIHVQSMVLNTNKHVTRVEVKGLNTSTAQGLFENLCHPCTLKKLQVSNLCDVLNYNPVAIRIFCAIVNLQEVNKEHVNKTVTDSVHTDSIISTQQQLCEDKKQFDTFAVDLILNYIGRRLESSCISFLHKLCSLRRSLPLTEISSKINQLINLSLVTMKKEEGVSFISVDACLCKYLTYRKNLNAESDPDFSVLECWLSLTSNKLQSLIQDAEENAWPFVPEKWQFVKNVDKEENYNVKELLTSKNIYASSLTELQILQECLYHAYLQDDFNKLAAVLLVVDRFLYWQGDAKMSMDIVDYIQERNPQTAIAPQLVIRRVRFMKNNGNLQEAEETLNRLLQAKSKIGQWKYRKEHEFCLVSGVCVQIKGEIQYRLGHWSKSASLLIESIGYFGSLPQPDKKGLASSYGLMCLCFRNMTVADYAVLARSFNLLQCHPLFAAYFSGQEAAKLSVYTPMFFLRHICQAGEVLLEFVNLVSDKSEKQQLLRVAIEDLKDSIQAHQTYASLTSREQFYLLVCAVYKISLALPQLQSSEDKDRGTTLKYLSSELYEHYCLSSDRVLINKDIIKIIDNCLHQLGLEQFLQENLPNAGEVLVNYCKMRTAKRLRENTSLSSVGFFANLKFKREVLKAAATAEIQEEQKQQQVIAQVHQDKALDETVNRSADTAEALQEEQVIPQTQQDKAPDETVDRSAGTAEAQEEEQVIPQAQQDKALDETVNRSAGTAEAQEEEQVIPQAQQDKALDDTVDRSAGTAEAQEEEQVISQTQQDKALDETVNRSAGTAEAQEEEQVIPQTQQGKALDETADRSADTAEAQKEQVIPQAHQNSTKLEQVRIRTVDQCALTVNTMDNGGQGIVIQSLVDEAASLPSQTRKISMTVFGFHGQENALKTKAKRVKDAILWKYDFPTSQWRGQPTMVYIGEPLKLDKGKEGSQRDVYTVEFINQDEQLGRYVAKRYRKNKTLQQYENDVLSQMTAKQYVALFNQQLYQAATGVAVGDIQFLPVVLLQLVNLNGQVTEVFNAEPYMSGEFTKLTNNTDWKNAERRTDLVLAYSHFTYQASNGNLIIVDIQGWTPLSNKGCTFLTDPQIHSTVYKCFGTGNFGEKGYDNFWKMHSQCNKICKMLGLVRPMNK